jgi:hypothetical protein
MTTNRILLTSTAALAIVLGMPSVANAAPAGSPTHVTAPYTTTYTGSGTDCKAGTTCTPVSTANSAGNIAIGMDMERVVADEPTPESGYAHGDQALDLRVPKGAKQLTATFHWTVQTASASARADHGVSYASTLMYAEASCSACTITDSADLVVSTSSVIPASDNTKTVADVQKTVTVTVSDLHGKGTVRVYSGASAHTDMNPDRFCTGQPGCDQLPPIDANHSGKVHADLDATLTSVDISYG